MRRTAPALRAGLLITISALGCNLLQAPARPAPTAIPTPPPPIIPTDPLLTSTATATGTPTGTPTFTPWPTLTPTITPTNTPFSGPALINRSFEDGTTGWEGEGLTSVDEVRCNVAHHRDCSFRVRGNGKQKVVFQDVSFHGLLGDAISFSVWAKNELLNPSDVFFFRVELVVTFKDGTTRIRQLDLDKNKYGWINIGGGLFADNDYTRIRIRLILQSDSGQVYWDDVRLEVTR